MNKVLAAVIGAWLTLFVGASATAGVTVTDAVLTKEKQGSAGQTPKKIAPPSGAQSGSVSAPSASTAKTKK